MRAVCVIGLGLIGGSVLRAAVRSGRPAWGATTSAEDAAAARAAGYEVLSSTERALERARERDALVVLATPLPAVGTVLREVNRHAPTTLLTDVVSVQEPMHDSVRESAPAARYAGGHPMAGTDRSGWEAGSAELFDGALWAVTIGGDTGLDAWREAALLALDCGARVVPASPAEHDAAVARVSHLPHLLAAVLASVGGDGGPLAESLAAGSFRDGTRVIATDPDLVRAMTEGNRAALLDALDDTLGRLGAARGALASTGSLNATLRSGHQARAGFYPAEPAEPVRTTVRLDAGHALRRLRELGESGARVVSLAEDTAVAEHRPVPATNDEAAPSGE
ncbi:prephenate dehydrogenase [Actinopolyspora lacussalsi subsp. righensis]|uniref:Prephenate dehydrogenase n=1 Tax=Actinopolyspora righensis TaxID=995060 RepID=A0A1I7BSC7_9ACTN|nr:prephenate dehydrogenase [Actinopolyspora righensis]SFT90087.1 prephenate dehydrogenase [Actinopolyspora righensis]